jgi:hypothetical protein
MFQLAFALHAKACVSEASQETSTNNLTCKEAAAYQKAAPLLHRLRSMLQKESERRVCKRNKEKKQLRVCFVFITQSEGLGLPPLPPRDTRVMIDEWNL